MGKFARGEALVVPDNGKTKACASCRFLDDDRCMLMGELAVIDRPRDMVCGYWLGHKPIRPGLAGLARVKGGTCCGTCVHWDGASERCGLVAGVLHEHNCCALWENPKLATPYTK